MPFLAPLIGAVVGAVGSIGSFITGLGFFGKLIIGIGLNVASALIQKALAKKQKAPPGGVQFERQYGADVPRQVACGLVGIAGHDCYVNTYGASNKFLQQIYTLSDYPSDGLSRVSINGEWATLGSTADTDKGYPVTSGEFANLIWIKFLDGSQTTANAYLVDNANPSARWTSAHIGVGLTAILVSMTFDQSKNSQFPDFFFEVRAAKLYDWRKDSSVGGSGSHRWNDPATHEFSENPIVIEYNYRRGFSVNGDLFCGMDMPAGDLPLDKWTAAANICDETVDDEKRYRCSILLDCMSTHGDNIESIALSCGAMSVDGVEGSWPIVGSDQPTVITFTDDDLITTAPVRYRAKRSQSELVNSVSGNFPDPDNLWSMVGYEPQISAAHVTLDRRTRDLAIDFPQVRSQRQAAQLASIYLYENRYEATATVTLRPRFQVLEPGDWVQWNSTRYGNKTYIVTETQLMSLDSDGPRNIQVSLQERDGAIYGAVSPPAIIVPTPPGTPTYLNEVQDFTLVAVSISGADGRLAPAIRASWSAPQDATVTAVEVQYYPTAQPTSIIYKTVPVGTTVTLLAEGVIAGTEYTVKTKLVTDPLRVTAWSAGATVTTDLVPSDVDVYLANVKGDAYETLQRIQSEMDELSARMDVIAAGSADATGASIDLHSVARRFQNATAVAMTEMSASIEQTEDGLAAQAAILDAVQAIIGDVEAGVLWRMTAEAGAGDVVARVVLQVRATVGDDWISAGTLWEAGFTGGNPALPFSRVMINAGQFVITDGTNSGTPFVYTGSVLWLNGVKVDWADIANAVIGWAEIGDAVVNNFVAGTANIGNLVVGTSNLDFGAVTDSAELHAVATNLNGNGVWHDVETLTIDNPSDIPVFMEISGTVTVSGVAGASGNTKARLINVSDGNSVVYETATATITNGGSSTVTLSNLFRLSFETVQGSNQYKFQQFTSAAAGKGSCDVTVGMLWWKR
ncbi:hypothetical protein ASD64_08905 [Mesorhizobium sp. Root157]|uniref:phage tail protein n=1 Tax=Mesorhizobium sp. Root157 TaxID=1736477 RepID=UPI0006F310CA|nr:phage tail protein [Mesorhizobium sp. Root157]KQZ81868.1 hypothetical protein ASD64_08905 [Mesorhizobium sp. Root157]